MIVGPPRSERERLKQPTESKPDICQPRLIVNPHAQYQMRARTNRTWPSPSPGARQQHLYLEPELLQSGLEQQILLKAVSTLPLPDELALDIHRIQRDRLSGPWVEVLKRNRRRVGTMDCGKRRRTAKLDPIQVGAEIEHHAEPY